MDLNQKLTGIMTSKEVSVQVRGHEARKFTLQLDFSNCTIADLLELATRPCVIMWQNANRAKGDEHLAKLPREITIIVSPTRSKPVEVEFLNKASTMSQDKIEEYIRKLEELMSRRNN